MHIQGELQHQFLKDQVELKHAMQADSNPLFRADSLHPPAMGWELAESLLETLAEGVMPESPYTASRVAMMQQIQTNAAWAMLGSAHQGTISRAAQLLSSFGPPVLPAGPLPGQIVS